MITLKDIQDAAQTISAFVHETPLVHSNSFSEMTGADVYIKAENFQKTGSFKVRGAFNKISSLREKKVIAASMGNHAQGVAFAASRIGIPAKIIMPLNAPLVKQEATKGYGAEVELYGETFQEALEYAQAQKDYTFVHAFDDEAVIAGQGTIGLEVLSALHSVDAVLVPVGGGGLISGIAVAIKSISPRTEVIGVQTASAASACESFRRGSIQECMPASTLADGIAVGKVGRITFGIMRDYVDDMMTVHDDSIAMAILLFMERKKMVAEGAGAVSLAALIDNADRFRGKKVVLLVSGGNIDFTLIDRIIHKGMARSGRVGTFGVTVDDIPGKLHLLTGIIARQRGNILSIEHDRLSPDLTVSQTRVMFTVEVRNSQHLRMITDEMEQKGFVVGEADQEK
ncbi:MAG TPA: threonine ammonia-lyase [Thermodesulfovibrionales bacterium]|nr:threonine ammonia-lyase [Thermodesulfovibrionales bacterium]